jgi:hypothetical protein
MKINYLFKNMGRACLVTGLLTTTLVSSCLKDNSPGTINFGDSPALVEWQYKGFSATPYTAPVLPVAGFTFNLEVALSVKTVFLNTPVTVTAVEDATLLPAGTTELPAADYTLPNGGKITINPGQQLVQFTITFAGDKIDFTQKNTLALKLTSPSGAQLTTNLNVAIVNIKVKSPFDDTYTVVSGATTRYKGPTVAAGVQDQFPVTESSIPLSTITADEVSGQAGSSLFALTAAFTIVGTNVSVSADPAGTVGSSTFNYINGDSKGVSSYDPATKTLILHYSYLNGAGNLREVDMVLKGQ